MGAVRLGKMLLRWCHHCNLPILEEKQCGFCGGNTQEVRLTPPGDPRPAFAEDIKLLRKVIDDQFGEGCGEALLPEGKIVLLNKVPALDRMSEVVLDGQVIGSLRFDPGRGWTFVTRMETARVLQSRASKGCVVADDGAVEAIVNGMNLMAPGVLEVRDDVHAGDEVLVITREKKAIATGIARMDGRFMASSGRGLAVKTRWTGAPMDTPETKGGGGWEEALKANRMTIDRAVLEAGRFVRRTMEKESLPAVISFSGGKDSLACALVILDAGYTLPLLFIDTGLEFKETVDFVRDFASRHELPLIWEKAEEKAFEEGLNRFGPPSRDFRWCCKTNKLGPTVNAIGRHFPKGVLSFIGQRRYESENRAQKSRVWRNPWVPGQIGAAPIQNWTALHVWMYIFMKDEEYNPWYSRGLDRIGCLLCPAADLGELDLIRDRCEQLTQWESRLREIAMERGLQKEWLDYALWRWRKVPGSMLEELRRQGIDADDSIGIAPIESEALDLIMEEPSFEEGIYRARGNLARDLDLEKVCNLLNIHGEPRIEGGACLLEDTRITTHGEILVEGKNIPQLRERITLIFKSIVKSEECVGCGLCVGLCRDNALYLKDGKVRISEEKCVHCGRCLEPCPALYFGRSELEF